MAPQQLNVRLDVSECHLLSYPRDYDVQHFVQRRGRTETEHLRRLAHVGHPFLHVIGIRWIADVAE